ncbi:MAG: WYL domain-containing protein [Coriobacteriia bacterium]|nr:WYL domain-containing protein [Coriobacteriia bacterium]
MANKKRAGSGETPLKLIPLCILHVLEEFASADKPMNEAGILRQLGKAYGLTLDRKTVSNNLKMLADFDQRIGQLTKPRSDGKGGQQEVSTGWYCDSYFETAELRYLADALICDDRIPQKQRRDLFEKLQGLGGGQKLTGLRDIYGARPKALANKQIFFTIDVLAEALSKGYCVQFRLGARDLQGKLTYSLERGGDKFYVVEPLFLAVSNGRYYLVASYPECEKKYHFRVDLMLEANMCKDKKGKEVPASRYALKKPEVQTYISEHLYMYTDAAQKIVFRISDESVARHQVFDYFGTSASMQSSKDAPGHIDVAVSANLTAMRYWALQFSDMVEVLSPKNLRDDICAAAQAIVDKYK